MLCLVPRFTNWLSGSGGEAVLVGPGTSFTNPDDLVQVGRQFGKAICAALGWLAAPLSPGLLCVALEPGNS